MLSSDYLGVYDLQRDLWTETQGDAHFPGDWRGGGGKGWLSNNNMNVCRTNWVLFYEIYLFRMTVDCGRSLSINTGNKF